MKRCSPVVVALVLAALGGCADSKFPGRARHALENADQWELLSLDPELPRDVPQDAFHGWRVLGSVAVADTGTRAKLVAALKEGVREHDGKAAKCFNPRHGIRALRGGKAVEFVICFECYQVEVYTADRSEDRFLISRSPQSVFDQTLREAGVPLPEPAKK